MGYCYCGDDCCCCCFGSFFFVCGMKFEFLGKIWSCRSGEKEEEEWIIMAV